MTNSRQRSYHQVGILVGWKIKLLTQKKWTDTGWLDWKGMLNDKRSGRRYCRWCCCIREVEEECKRRSWPSSAAEEEEEEEVWAPHDYGPTDEGKDIVENS